MHAKLKSHLRDESNKTQGSRKREEKRNKRTIINALDIFLPPYQEFHEEIEVFQLILLIPLQLNQMVIQDKFELIMNVLLDYMFELFVLDDLILIQHQALSIVH